MKPSSESRIFRARETMGEVLLPTSATLSQSLLRFLCKVSLALASFPFPSGTIAVQFLRVTTHGQISQNPSSKIKHTACIKALRTVLFHMPRIQM